MLGKIGCDLCAPAAVICILVHYHQLAGLADGLDDSLIVKGNERAGVDDLAGDTLLFKLGGSLLRAVAHEQVRNDGDVLTLAADGGFSERDGVIAVRHLARRVESARLFTL